MLTLYKRIMAPPGKLLLHVNVMQYNQLACE